jgi:magnesium-transporting ATPase (P-type)
MAMLAYTFGTGLAGIALIAWIVVWLVFAVRIVRRSDLGFGGKVFWLVIILVIPLVGLLIYVLWDASRPART